MQRVAQTGLTGPRATWITTLALVAGLAGGTAQAQAIRPAVYAGAAAPTRAQLTLAGHDGVQLDNLPVQHITRVAALPRRDGDGRLYSFSTAYAAFVPDELKSWRLSFLAGKLMGRTFQIAGNGPDSITVTDLNGPLDSIAVGDPVMVESIVVRDIPLR
jgi:hypothetical protein